MATIKQLKEGEEVIYPLTSTKAIVDEDGKRVIILASNLTSIESITEEEYNTKLADGTLSETTMYVIV